MSVKLELPAKKAVIFWRVGCRDSATLVLSPRQVVMQIGRSVLVGDDCGLLREQIV